MGQHTWFLKNKELYLKTIPLIEKLNKFENNEIYLDNLELFQINSELDELDKQNKTEYHDLFRTNKRNNDKTYINDVIFSKKECFEWINDPKNLVSFKHTVFDSFEQEKIYQESSISKLHEFWDKYPEGVIIFG